MKSQEAEKGGANRLGLWSLFYCVANGAPELAPGQYGRVQKGKATSFPLALSLPSSLWLSVTTNHDIRLAAKAPARDSRANATRTTPPHLHGSYLLLMRWPHVGRANSHRIWVHLQEIEPGVVYTLSSYSSSPVAKGYKFAVTEGEMGVWEQK